MKRPEKIVEQLQDAELAVLKQLKQLCSASVSELATRTRLPEVTVGRAALWLGNKSLIKTSKQKSKYITLDTNGKKYSEAGLPELNLLDLIKKRPMNLEELRRQFSDDEVRFSIGKLKKEGLIVFYEGKVKAVPFKRSEPEEAKLLRKLAGQDLNLADLSVTEKKAVEELRRRKSIIRELERTEITVQITELGRKVGSEVDGLAKGRIGELTSAMLKAGSWKEKAFRRYDVEAPVPRMFSGKKQPYLAFLDEVKKELVSMGFKEMIGPIVEASFFNCDALYMPQDHPARGIHDIYFVKGKASLNRYAEALKAVKETHENGGETGSAGWRVPFSEDVAEQLMLRSQGTALSARMLMSKKLEIPSKYFAVARIFRPDVVDPTHLTEFNQLEGIVIGEEVNFRQLLGLLKDFAVKVAGAKKIKFTPVAYFPFTEPSVTGYIWHEGLGKWIECMPAGIFRPELCKPLGIDVPVLAWGLGVDRLFMIKEGIKDIRQLFSSDLDWLRRAKV